MAHPLRAWLAELIEWARVVDRDAEDIADLILDEILKGGEATPPDPTPDT